jgi:hypothetical protein
VNSTTVVLLVCVPLAFAAGMMLTRLIVEYAHATKEDVARHLLLASRIARITIAAAIGLGALAMLFLVK